MTQAIEQYADGDIVILTQKRMEGLGFSKSARTYCAYWSANPAGRTARSMGWTPSLRTMDGEKVLFLTKVA